MISPYDRPNNPIGLYRKHDRVLGLFTWPDPRNPDVACAKTFYMRMMSWMREVYQGEARHDEYDLINHIYLHAPRNKGNEILGWHQQLRYHPKMNVLSCMCCEKKEKVHQCKDRGLKLIECGHGRFESRSDIELICAQFLNGVLGKDPFADDW